MEHVVEYGDLPNGTALITGFQREAPVHPLHGPGHGQGHSKKHYGHQDKVPPPADKAQNEANESPGDVAHPACRQRLRVEYGQACPDDGRHLRPSLR